MKIVLGWVLTIGLAAAAVPLMRGVIHAQAGYCYWICSPFGGPVWHCDERYGPWYPPTSPPPRCR